MERGWCVYVCVCVCVCVCLVGGRTSHHCNFRPSRHGDRAWAHVGSQFTNTRPSSSPWSPPPIPSTWMMIFDEISFPPNSQGFLN